MSLTSTISPCCNVRRTASVILENPNPFVTIDFANLVSLAKKIEEERDPGTNAFTSWDEHGWHYTAGTPEQTALYVLVLDAL